MPLFQKSVLNKFIKSQDSAKIDSAYQRFSDIFLQADRQSEIRSMKEEEYQDGFLDDLFVSILGYIKRPNAGFNLVREKKNEADSKKADGAILKNDSPLAVIELKGTDTTDLDKVTNQGFGYKNNHKECVYVVISNFEKLRFFIHHAVDYIEFNLFTLSKEEFTTLWLCLHSENLLDNIPAKIKAESVVKEEDITKNLYKDYSSFKQELWQDIVKSNPSGDPLVFYKKTQKLIDRFLFIFFAEDAGLLPPNSISRMVDRWKMLKEEDAYKPLYEIFKQYFGYINTGRSGKTPQDEIFAYNGGLMAEDEVLETVLISDEVLLKHVSRLTTYDFSSEVDVNILGHIFENSLNDIEAVTAQLEGQEIDKSKTKRKKDGVFYTPKYITKYIVDNTVGKLCDEKKAELQIIDEEYAKGRTNRKKETLKKLDENLQAYRNWLLDITICDPACGSGAFLNQALEYLMEEHRYIDELESQLLGAGFTFPGVENHILENNIFGVDINEESIEIAKLSLWLRTAQRGRKLTSLNNNIKCGNSLIDDPEVAGEKAFDWVKEFPDVFAKGGFDVVIGNPPYVQLQSMGKMSDDLKNIGFETYEKSADIYCLFTEKGYKLLKEDGIQSFIMPNKWMIVSYGKPLRKFLSKTGMLQMLNFGDIQFFDGAATIVCIFVTQKKEPQDKIKVLSLNQRSYTGDFFSEINSNIYEYPSTNFDEKEWIIKPFDIEVKLEKMKQNGIELNKLNISIYRGILTGYNDAFFINEATRQRLIEEDSKSEEIIHRMLRGRDIIPYGNSDFEYLIGTFPSVKIDIEKFPAIKKHLLSFGFNRLKQTGDVGARKKTKGEWFETQDSISYWREFNKPKIIYPNMTSVFPFMYDESGVFTNQKCFILSSNDEKVSLLALTAIFNSSLCKLWISYNCPELLGGTREISKVYFEKFPVPVFSDLEKVQLENFTNSRISKTNNYLLIINKITKYFTSQHQLEKLSGKLEKWYELEFADFIKELNKAIKAVKGTLLTKKDEFEWMELFEENKKKALDLKSQIDLTDKEIDRMVYELYGLTEEEIKIVENS